MTRADRVGRHVRVGRYVRAGALRGVDRAEQADPSPVEHCRDLDLAALGPDERDEGGDPDVALALDARDVLLGRPHRGGHVRLGQPGRRL